MSPNPYEVLGIPVDADRKTIGTRFRRLAKDYHPDATGGDKSKEEHFKRLSAAYKILSDQRKCATLDDQLRAAARSSRSSSTKTRTNSQASKEGAPTSSASAKRDGTSPGSAAAADEEWLGDMSDLLDDLWENVVTKGKDASPPNGGAYKYTKMAMDSTRDAPKHKRLMLVSLAMLADTLKAVCVARPSR
jgi:DnaJ-class molecular chaperone